jgi:hypothetical protein
MNFRSRIIDLHIIDAPSKNYGRLGASEAIALQFRLRDTNINIVPHVAWDEASLRRRLNQVLNFRALYKSPRKALPFVHIASAHGNPDGFWVGANVPVGWPLLNDMLSQINVATGNNLLLGLSSCRGLYGYRMACIGDQKPFHLLVAPKKAKSTSQLVNGFARFYRSLLHDYTSRKRALEAANEVPHRGGPLLESLYGWEVRKAFDMLGYDDPRRLTHP